MGDNHKHLIYLKSWSSTFEFCFLRFCFIYTSWLLKDQFQFNLCIKFSRFPPVCFNFAVCSKVMKYFSVFLVFIYLYFFSYAKKKASSAILLKIYMKFFFIQFWFLNQLFPYHLGNLIFLFSKILNNQFKDTFKI